MDTRNDYRDRWCNRELNGIGLVCRHKKFFVQTKKLCTDTKKISVQTKKYIKKRQQFLSLD